MKNNQQNLKSLISHWYQKLKQDGFQDIEQQDSHQNLKDWHSFHFSERFNETTFSIRENYYQKATTFYNEYEFSTPLEKEIWKLHSEGLSLRTIANIIDKESNNHTPYCSHETCDLFCPYATQNQGIFMRVVNKDKINGIVKVLAEKMLKFKGREEQLEYREF